MPKISILMPVYNAAEFLDESISSILNQTFTDFELLILDDASQDHSINIIEKYEKKDKRIKFFKNKTNKKANISRNILLNFVKTEYFGWMDADDISLKNRLQIQYDFLQNNPDIDIVGGKNWDNQPKTDLQIKSMLFRGSPIINSTSMIRTKIIKANNIQYKNHLYSAHDYQFWMDCAPFAKFINLDDNLVQYRIHDGQMSAKHSHQQENFHLQILKEYFEKFDMKISKDLIEIIVGKNNERLTFQNLVQIKNQYFKPILNIKNFYDYPKVSRGEITKSFLIILYNNRPYSLLLFARLCWEDKIFSFKMAAICLGFVVIWRVKRIKRKFFSS
jgi:glycosyltransferase involved in cell wall biosynthesis